MNQFPISDDIQILIWLPLALLTIKEVKENWRQIFDRDLTVKDRSSLHKINMFFLLPLVVLIHEIGHALATIYLGGTVKELHFGIWWGYVIPVGDFSNLDHLIITLAGNVAQIAIGFICLAAAYFLRSPATVALLVYCGLYSIGWTAFAYTLMSFAGMYGDWIMIYSSPHKEIITIVATIHIIVVGLLIYMIYGAKPRLWFAGKTRPKWLKDNQAALARVDKDPSAINYLGLAWSYFFIGMDKLAEKYLVKVEEKDPSLMERFYLEGCILQNRGKRDEAISCFEKIAREEGTDTISRARALMAVAHCLSDDLPADLDNDEARELSKNILETFDQAASLVPDTADPLFYKASLFNKLGLHKEAEKILKDLDGRKWLDPSLRAGTLVELKVARSSESQDK